MADDFVVIKEPNGALKNIANERATIGADVVYIQKTELVGPDGTKIVPATADPASNAAAVPVRAIPSATPQPVSVDGLVGLAAGAETIGKVDQGAAGVAAWPVSITDVATATKQDEQTASLGTDGATPPTIAGTGVRGWLRAVYERADIASSAVRDGVVAAVEAVRDRLPAALGTGGGVKASLVDVGAGATAAAQATAQARLDLLASEAKLEAVRALLASIEAEDFATQSTLDALRLVAVAIRDTAGIKQIVDPVAIAGTVPVSGPLTDAELRAAALPLPADASTATAQATAQSRLDLLATEATLAARLPAALTAGGGVKVGLVDALPSGANTIGKVDQGTGGASAWLVADTELSWDDSAAFEGASVSKASAGTLYEVIAHNKGFTTMYLQIHNRVVAPTAGQVPVTVVPIPGGGVSSITPAHGKAFSTGITWAQSTTAATYTAPGTSDLWVNLGYI